MSILCFFVHFHAKDRYCPASGAQGLTAWGFERFMLNERTKVCMMGNTGSRYNSMSLLAGCHCVARTHTLVADSQEPFLLRRHRSGILLSVAPSCAGVCYGWSWKPDPFLFTNRPPAPPLVIPLHTGSMRQ